MSAIKTKIAGGLMVKTEQESGRMVKTEQESGRMVKRNKHAFSFIFRRNRFRRCSLEDKKTRQAIVDKHMHYNIIELQTHTRRH